MNSCHEDFKNKKNKLKNDFTFLQLILIRRLRNFLFLIWCEVHQSIDSLASILEVDENVLGLHRDRYLN